VDVMKSYKYLLQLVLLTNKDAVLNSVEEMQNCFLGRLGGPGSIFVYFESSERKSRFGS
jgi:hypothetical protein